MKELGFLVLLVGAALGQTTPPDSGTIVDLKPSESLPFGPSLDEPTIAEINQYWESYYILRENTLIDLIVYAEKRLWIADDIFDLCKENRLPFKFDAFLDRYANTTEVMKFVTEFRDPPPTFYLSLYELVDTFSRNTTEQQDKFLERLESGGAVHHFFATIRDLDHGYGNFFKMYDMSLLMRKPFWRELLNSWMSLSAEDKETMKRVYSTDIDKDECSEIMHKTQNNQDFMDVINVKECYHNGGSCSSKFSIKKKDCDLPAPQNGPYASWSDSKAGSKLVELLKYAEKYEGSLSEIYLIAQSSTSEDLFVRLDSLIEKFPRLNRTVELLIETQKSNFSQIQSMTEWFYGLSSTEKEDLFPTTLDRNNFVYLIDIWFMKPVVPNLELLKLFNDPVKTDFLTKVIRVWAEFDEKEKSTVKMVFDGASREMCKTVLVEKVKIVEMARFLDSNGFSSCFKKYELN